MVYHRIVVYVLLPVGHDTAAEITFSTLAFEYKVGTIACNSVVKCDDIVIHPTVGLLLDIHIAHPDILVMGFLQTVKIELSVGFHVRLYHLCGQEIAVVHRVIAEKKLCFCTFFEYDQHPAVDHQIDIRAENIHHLNGAIYLYAPRNIHNESVFGQHRVERRYRIVGRLGQLCIITGNKLGPISSHSVERINQNALGQLYFGLRSGVKTVVDNEIQ